MSPHARPRSRIITYVLTTLTSALTSFKRQLSTCKCQFLTCKCEVWTRKYELSSYEVSCNMSALLKYICVLNALLTNKRLNLTNFEFSMCTFSQTYKYVVLLCSLGVDLTYLKNKNVILNYKRATSYILSNKYQSDLRKRSSYLRVCSDYLRVCSTNLQVCSTALRICSIMGKVCRTGSQVSKNDLRVCSTNLETCSTDLQVCSTNLKKCSTNLRNLRLCSIDKRKLLTCPGSASTAVGNNYNLGRAVRVRSVNVSVVDNSRDLYIILNAAFLYPLFSSTDHLRLTKSHFFSFKFNLICLFIVIIKLYRSINSMASRVGTKCVQILMNLVRKCLECYDAIGRFSSYLKFIKRMYLIFFDCINFNKPYFKRLICKNQNNLIIFLRIYEKLKIVNSDISSAINYKYQNYNFYAHHCKRYTYALEKFSNTALKIYSCNLSTEFKNLSSTLKQNFLSNLNCLSVIFHIVLRYGPVIFNCYTLNIIPIKFLYLSVIVMPYEVLKGGYDFLSLDILLLVIIIHSFIYFTIFKTLDL